MTLTTVIGLLGLCLLVRETSAARPLNVRISWLEERVAWHQYVCRRGAGENRVLHCRALRWSSRELRQARAEQYAREWDWRTWLPEKWQRIGACETGYGQQPGNWAWDSGRYVSAFGIYRPAYAQFAAIAGVPAWDAPGIRTPREQYRVALAIWRRYGFSGWGCRNA